MIAILAWLAVFWSMGSYLWMNKTGNIKQFNIMNFVAAFPIATMALVSGALPNVFISIFFGVIGAYGLHKGRKNGIQDQRREEHSAEYAQG